MSPSPKKLLDQVRDAIRLKHYSIRTKESDVNWVRRYILFHNQQHPKEMGSAEVSAFLAHLAVSEQVAAILILKNSCSNSCKVGIVVTSE